jgi:uncharacterized Zn-binding protein involved in type VI secretion
MRKAAVRHGDPTTTRGLVMAYSSTIHDHGKKVALSGDEATCGNCKGAYPIFGTGQRMREKGRVVVLDGDRVLCPCGKNRVIVGSSPGIWITTSDGSAGAKASTANNSSLAASIYDEQVTLMDRVNGQPLSDFPYRFRGADGTVVEGVTDASGRTSRVTTAGAANLDLEHMVGEGDGWE